MAKRPIYIARKDGTLGVDVKEIEFHWFPGMSKSQKQKSINSLHKAAKNCGVKDILEISSKSETELGISLSAFNLNITTQKEKRVFSVETAFQGSKVFENGGPFLDLFEKTSREAKNDSRLKISGDLIKFTFYNFEFPLKPRTFFYDWLYINALYQNDVLVKQVLKYSAFTDIEFNPKKSINCQAFSAALFVSLQYSPEKDKCIKSPNEFLNLLENFYRHSIRNSSVQKTLF
jgi:hypothetical protein